MKNFDLIKQAKTVEQMAELLTKNFYSNLPMHQELIKRCLMEWLNNTAEGVKEGEGN